MLYPVSVASRPETHIVDAHGDVVVANDFTKPIIRWTIRHKERAVLAVRGGLVTIEYLTKKYDISSEEIHSWARLLRQHGPAGMRTTRTQDYAR